MIHLPASKESSCNAGNSSSIPGSGRSPGGGHGNPLEYSCLENPMDRGAWRATVHGAAKSQIWLKWPSMHIHTFNYPNNPRRPVLLFLSYRWKEKAKTQRIILSNFPIRLLSSGAETWTRQYTLCYTASGREGWYLFQTHSSLREAGFRCTAGW